MKTVIPLDLSFVRINDIDIAYFEYGAGPTLILIHGMFGDYLDWEPVLEPLSANFHVVAVDLPGFGSSSKPDVDYSAEFFVDCLHTLFQRMGLARFYLVGNSFGGQLAILYALRYPREVGKLVLVDSGGLAEITYEKREQTMLAFSEDHLRRLNWTGIRYVFSPIFEHSSGEMSRYLERQTARLRSGDYPEYARAIARAIRTSISTYLLDRLNKLTCPTLLVWGEQDVVLPVEQGRTAVKELRSGTLYILHGCGHMPQLESPKEFTGVLQSFLLESPAQGRIA